MHICDGDWMSFFGTVVVEVDDGSGDVFTYTTHNRITNLCIDYIFKRMIFEDLVLPVSIRLGNGGRGASSYNPRNVTALPTPDDMSDIYNPILSAKPAVRTTDGTSVLYNITEPWVVPYNPVSERQNVNEMGLYFGSFLAAHTTIVDLNYLISERKKRGRWRSGTYTDEHYVNVSWKFTFGRRSDQAGGFMIGGDVV